MGILLGFSPFIVFALLTNLSVDLALWLALAVAFAVAIRDFAHTRLLRMLDVGSTLIFAILALYTGFIQPSLSVQAVRLIIDGGLLTLAVTSIVSGNPFTLDYAREQVPQEIWQAPAFLRTNYVVAWVWALAFAAMTAADAVATFDKRFPQALDVAAGLAALTLAVIFTARYPTDIRLEAARSTRHRRPRRR